MRPRLSLRAPVITRVTALAPVLAAALTAALVLSGCSLPWAGPAPDEAADKLATGLSAHEVKRIPFADPASAADAERVLAPLDGLASKVRVGGLSVDGDRATATLEWEITAGTGTWRHTTTARLVEKHKVWRVVWSPSIVEKSLGTGDSLDTSTVKAQRGRITGAAGVAIVEPRPVLRIGIDKAKLPAGRARQSATELARAVGIDPRRFADLVQKSGPRQFVQALVVRKQGLPADYGLTYSRIPGAVGLSDHLPLAPTKAFATQILGTVGPATAELVQKSKGRLRAGDDTGLSGLQLRYDEQLAGTSGLRISAVSATGERRELFTSQPEPGRDLATTLVPRLQLRADALLEHVAPASAIVAIRPSTGALLAVASGPGSQGYNTATFAHYAPGSTFKVVSALALLRAGLTPSSRVTCPAGLSVNGKKFKNYSDYPSSRLGTITLEQALANSCNTAFIGQRDRLGKGGLTSAAAALGIGVDHDLGFPAYFGSVPPPAGETERAADMIGQGKVLASPMAMATALASVLAGHTVVPELLPGAVPASPAGKPLPEAPALRRMLQAVVRDGSGARLQSLGPGYLAKTGTAEFGTQSPPQTHAWMLGGRGDLAVAVFVDVGESGSRTAGPILEAFLRAAARP